MREDRQWSGQYDACTNLMPKSEAGVHMPTYDFNLNTSMHAGLAELLEVPQIHHSCRFDARKTEIVNQNTARYPMCM